MKSSISERLHATNKIFITNILVLCIVYGTITALVHNTGLIIMYQTTATANSKAARRKSIAFRWPIFRLFVGKKITPPVSDIKGVQHELNRYHVLNERYKLVLREYLAVNKETVSMINVYRSLVLSDDINDNNRADFIFTNGVQHNLKFVRPHFQHDLIELRRKLADFDKRHYW